MPSGSEFTLRPLPLGLLALLIVVVVALMAPASASAHAVAETIAPPPGTLVVNAPQKISLQYSEQIRILTPQDAQVVDQDGKSVLSGSAQVSPTDSRVLEIPLKQGLPDGTYINIYATNDQIATAIADPRVQAVSLTGSGRAGAAVAEVAGRNLKKVVLELGGSDPFIVLATDDLDAVVEAAVGGRLENGGQACNAAKRFIVVDHLYEPFLDKFTEAVRKVEPADPGSPDTVLGPLSSASATERLEDQVKRAVDQGATLVAGGTREGNFFETTVLTGITPDNEAYKEEFFGPVASVYRVGSEDEAVALANDTPYGLGSYVFTNDSDQALRVADKIEAGMVFINAVGAEGVELPFGGVKGSGFGRELGRYGADEFVNKKLIRTGA